MLAGKKNISLGYFMRIMLRCRDVYTNYVLSRIASAKSTKLKKVFNNGVQSPAGGLVGSPDAIGLIRSRTPKKLFVSLQAVTVNQFRQTSFLEEQAPSGRIKL